MSKETLYAIEAHGMWRPGYVLDPGTAPGKVRVKVWWKWGDSMDEQWLNPQPNLLSEHARSETQLVTTAEVKEPWADWCAKRLAVNAAKLAQLQADEAEAARSKADLLSRINGLMPLLQAQGDGGYLDGRYLLDLANGDRINDTRFSGMHVLKLIEAINYKFDMVEHVDREGQ
jgi:hypothetical protein